MTIIELIKELEYRVECDVLSRLKGRGRIAVLRRRDLARAKLLQAIKSAPEAAREEK